MSRAKELSLGRSSQYECSRPARFLSLQLGYHNLRFLLCMNCTHRSRLSRCAVWMAWRLLAVVTPLVSTDTSITPDHVTRWTPRTTLWWTAKIPVQTITAGAKLSRNLLAAQKLPAQNTLYQREAVVELVVSDSESGYETISFIFKKEFSLTDYGRLITTYVFALPKRPKLLQ